MSTLLRSSTHRRSCIIGALALAALPACVDQPAVGQEHVAISNAREEPDLAYPWVVWIQTDASACHGALIAPGWVLTAAHCFDDGPNPDCDHDAGPCTVGEPDGIIDFGHGHGTVTVAGQTKEYGDAVGTGIFIHPNWRDHDFGSNFHDIALVRIPNIPGSGQLGMFDVDVAGGPRPIGLGLTAPAVGDVRISASVQLNGAHLPQGSMAVGDFQRSACAIPTRLCAGGVNGEVMDQGDSGSALVQLGGDEPRVVGLLHGSEQGWTDTWTNVVSGGTEASAPGDYRNWILDQLRSQRGPNISLRGRECRSRSSRRRNWIAGDRQDRRRHDLRSMWTRSSPCARSGAC